MPTGRAAARAWRLPYPAQAERDDVRDRDALVEAGMRVGLARRGSGSAADARALFNALGVVNRPYDAIQQLPRRMIAVDVDGVDLLVERDGLVGVGRIGGDDDPGHRKLSFHSERFPLEYPDGPYFTHETTLRRNRGCHR